MHQSNARLRGLRAQKINGKRNREVVGQVGGGAIRGGRACVAQSFYHLVSRIIRPAPPPPIATQPMLKLSPRSQPDAPHVAGMHA